jgi:hypothetical protein
MIIGLAPGIGVMPCGLVLFGLVTRPGAVLLGLSTRPGAVLFGITVVLELAPFGTVVLLPGVVVTFEFTPGVVTVPVLALFGATALLFTPTPAPELFCRRAWAKQAACSVASRTWQLVPGGKVRFCAVAGNDAVASRTLPSSAPRANARCVMSRLL